MFALAYNELSTPALEGQHLTTIARGWLVSIGDRIREADDVGAGAVLMIDFAALDSAFADEGAALTALVYALSPAERDTWRLVYSRIDRGKTNQLRFQEAANAIEVLFGEVEAKGVALAIAADALTVSASSEPPWDGPFLASTVSRLDDAGEMSVEVGHEAPHVSAAPHWASHESSLLHGAVAQASGRGNLWTSLSSSLTRVRFTKAVKGQIASLGAVELDSVLKRIIELQVSLRHWNPSAENQPTWASKVTPESESRRKHCWFQGDDGVLREYSMHARYTPGHGRIHFRFLDGESIGCVEIAYIGEKLGI